MSERAKFTVKMLKDVSPTTFSALRQRVGFSGTEVVRVGLPDDKMHKDDDKSGVPLSVIGAAHEFGVPDRNIPERPFLRPGIRVNTKQLIQLNRVNLLKVVRGELTRQQALNQLGIAAVGWIRQYIRKGISPPLKLSTLLRRGRTSKKAAKGYRNSNQSDKDLAALQASATPLIDTGQLIQGLTYQVKGRENV